ncbi:MAG: RICIN domain-containing protein, partial [Bacteroidaceae bacterium]|nr:RICIN domain-containing protein [Bacteroidaceae bacterium]
MNPDVKAAYGDDALELYRHFATFAIADERKTSPVFDISYYLENNTDLKAAFGTDLNLAYNHFKTSGYKETRFTNTPANLGNDFIAKIDMSYASLSLGLEGDNVVSVDRGSASLWHFTRQTDGTYTIQNTANKKVLDVYAGGKTNGANVQTYTSNDTQAQKWYIFENVNGTY